MRDSPFKNNNPPDPQVKGDFDALLDVSPREAVAQRTKPVIVNLRKRNSFKPQGSLDSAGSFVSAASSASEPESIRQVTAPEDSENGMPEGAAVSSMADMDVQLPPEDERGHATYGTAQSDLDNGAGHGDEKLDEGNSDAAIREVDKGASSELTPTVELGASVSRPTQQHEKVPDPIAQPQSAASGPRNLSQEPAEIFAEALEGMQLQPEESAELPVSTLRAGRCLSGSVLAEDEADPSSSGMDMQGMSTEEQDLLAAASRAGQAESSGHSDSKRQGEVEPWHGSKGAADAGRPLSSFQAPSFLAWEPRDARGADGLGMGSDEEEGQELGVWRGSGQDFVPTSVPGSSPDSYAALSFEMRSMSGDAAEAIAMQQPGQINETPPVQSSMGTRTGSDVGTAGGDLDDDFSAAEASATSHTDPSSPRVLREEAAAEASSLGRAASSAAVQVGQNEDSLHWRSQRKHFFVLTNAGRPVFTVHGSEHALAGFMAIIDAMMSFVKDRGDSLQTIRAGNHIIVFLERGPLYLVAVSSTGEPASVLRLQLDLLHAHLRTILTDEFEKRLVKNPRYDMARRLLGGTGDVLRRFLASFDTSPSAMLNAFEPLRLAADARHTVLQALQSAMKRSNATHGVLLAGERAVGLAQQRTHAMHAKDLLLLASFVLGFDSFRAADESMSPICLPHFNPSQSFFGYVHYLDPEMGLCLVLLSQYPDSFHRLADSAARLQRYLAQCGIPQVIKATLEEPGQGRLHIPSMPPSAGGGAFGMTALQHFVYNMPARGQYVMSAFSALLTVPDLQQEVMPAYARAHTAMFSEADGALHLRQAVHFTRDDSRTVLAYLGVEYEVYAQFDALTDRDTALTICSHLCAWIKGQHPDLFVPNPSM